MTQKHDFEQINPQTNASGRDAARQLSRRGFLKVSGMTAITAAGLTFLTACGPAAQGTSDKSSSSSSKSDTGVLGDGKTLRVGMEAAYAPYNWQTTQESEYTIPIENVDGAYADGYDVQFAKVVGKALGMKPVAVKMSFSGLIDALNNGQIDVIIAGMSATKERKQSIDFSKPYFVGGFGLLVKKDSKYASAKSLEDFSGAAVLGQKDTLLDTVIDEIPNVNHLTPVATVPLVVDGLMNGTCDAITFSSLSLPRLLKDYPTLKKVDLADGEGFTDASNPDNAAIAKGQDAVLAKINEVIDGISADERQSMWDDCMDRQPA